MTSRDRIDIAGMGDAGSGEEQLISRHFRPLATQPGALGLLDDAAVVGVPPGHDLVVKTDAIVGGVHFFPDDPPDAVARKALRVNLSDLAAKGAKPLGFLLSIALPTEIDDRWLGRFAAALGADAERFGCPLFGGDTDRTPGPVTISISAFGTVPHGTMVLRSGAKSGDRLVVTGAIGDAAVGLVLRRDPHAATRWGLDPAMREHLLRRYLVPEPRNAIAEALRRHAHGGMDVSDGLAGDLAKMCRASHVTATVEVARVPLSEATRQALAAEPGLLEAILTGGDDYEVLASVAESEVGILAAEAAAAGITLTEIGAIEDGEGKARFLRRDGTELAFVRASFSHF
jgi:thiamine-monophosphate kinase